MIVSSSWRASYGAWLGRGRKGSRDADSKEDWNLLERNCVTVCFVSAGGLVLRFELGDA